MRSGIDFGVARAQVVELHTRLGSYSMRVRVADTFFTRLSGLMLRAPLPPLNGLLLMRCSSVHTAFMRAPIDIVYLDAGGTVLQCVPLLKPWRASICRARAKRQGRRAGTVHCLELQAGSIDALGIREGDRLAHPDLKVAYTAYTTYTEAVRRGRGQRQRGAAMVEFVLVGPIIALLGLGSLQYGLLFFAKNHLNHASFMAARAGSMGNADLQTVRSAYERALVPLYGGGESASELAAALTTAQSEVGTYVRIELLNPTKASFDDWNDPVLQKTLGAGRRVIPNTGQAWKDPAAVGARSGQNIQDANLIKLRFTHGFEPKVPIVRTLYTRLLKWMDTGEDSFHTDLVNAGRIPVFTHATLHMHSNAIEQADAVLSPGGSPGGESGSPNKPAPIPGTPPACPGRCAPGNPDLPDTPDGSDDRPGSTCEEQSKVNHDLQLDKLFDFDKSSVADMRREGREILLKVIAEARTNPPASVHIVGYTDQLGSEAYNLSLSRARAKSVREFLQTNGFPDVPITTEGRGEAEPVVPLAACSGKSDAETKQCLAPNRRAVLIMSGVEALP